LMAVRIRPGTCLKIANQAVFWLTEKIILFKMSLVFLN